MEGIRYSARLAPELQYGDDTTTPIKAKGKTVTRPLAGRTAGSCPLRLAGEARGEHRARHLEGAHWRPSVRCPYWTLAH